MKKQVFLRWLWCIMEYLMVFPLVVILTGFTLSYNATIIFAVTLPIHLFFGIILTYILRRFRNVIAVLVGIAYVTIINLIFMLTLSTGEIGRASCRERV